MLETIKNSLAKDIIQRITYLVGIFIWTLYVLNILINYPFTESSLGISYFILCAFPLVILALQVILNNKALWFIITLSYNIFLTLVSLSTIYFWITNTTQFQKNILFTVLIFSMSIFSLIIYWAKPKRVLQ